MRNQEISSPLPLKSCCVLSFVDPRADSGVSIRELTANEGVVAVTLAGSTNERLR